MFADFAVSNNIAFPKNILLREIIFSKSPFSTMIRMPYETLGILFWAIAESLTHGSNQQVIFYHTNTIKNIILNKYLISQNIKLLDLKMWSLKGFFPHFFNVLLRAGGQVCKLSTYKKKKKNT